MFAQTPGRCPAPPPPPRPLISRHRPPNPSAVPEFLTEILEVPRAGAAVAAYLTSKVIRFLEVLRAGLEHSRLTSIPSTSVAFSEGRTDLRRVAIAFPCPALDATAHKLLLEFESPRERGLTFPETRPLPTRIKFNIAPSISMLLIKSAAPLMYVGISASEGTRLRIAFTPTAVGLHSVRIKCSAAASKGSKRRCPNFCGL
ncbi:hypothetical protein C8R44DRAFT_738724 [Mycena epipterygia]|nr:hypothetical protein C8R44DRAFT_738724 [Mycena epipterygia]